MFELFSENAVTNSLRVRKFLDLFGVPVTPAVRYALWTINQLQGSAHRQSLEIFSLFIRLIRSSLL